MLTRRILLTHTVAVAGASALPSSAAAAPASPARGGAHTPVMMPNGATLAHTMDGDTKVFHLVAEPVKHEFGPGMTGDCWGYNGQVPGPVIEAVEGDHLRIFVTNKLPEPTTIHWHGVLLPSGMDGVGGLSHPWIKPGETYAYEFTLRQHGTQMYHPHADEMVQMALGMMGFFVIHPRRPARRVDRDFVIFLQEWFVEPGSSRPNPLIMLDFNLFTFNGRAFPGTAPLVVKLGERVRIRLANLSMDSHPIHLHGHKFRVTGTDGGPVPTAAQIPETTVNVPVGATRDFEFVADNPGDWALHCHKSHHTMNMMNHDIPNMLGVDQSKVEPRLRRLFPGYMAMGQTGMGQMHDMGRPPNTLPMLGGEGPFGPIEMGGMFTILKVRESLEDLPPDGGWYAPPPGTVARKVEP